MTAMTLRLPEHLHKQIKVLAESEGVSINQFMTLAAVEKVTSMRTIDFMRAEAQKGSRADFDAFLAAIPDADPIEGDVL